MKCYRIETPHTVERFTQVISIGSGVAKEFIEWRDAARVRYYVLADFSDAIPEFMNSLDGAASGNEVA